MSQGSSELSSFRKDINWLRAVAVIAVVTFHFYPSLLSGGFAGVDVFFVISGFLMTGIIFRGLESENFSILNFYISRANRIIPSLGVLCLVLLILGWFYLTIWDFKTIGRDIATSMLFISNIMFSMRSGYFDSNENFLLHTWSLSVEWQFYIIYPVIIVVLNKFLSEKNLKRSVVVLCLTSFAISVIATNYFPSQSYFLLPTRAWEMLIGGIAYLYPFKAKSKIFHLNNKLLVVVGLLLILISYFFFSSKTIWPGYLAFLPVIGTWLIIQAKVNDNYITDNLVFQKIGLWSYSIYLWHWPIAVCFSYYAINERYKALGIVLSVLLGYLNFILVEKRRLKFTTLIKPIIGYTALSLCFGLIGSIIFKTQGFAIREALVSNSLIHGGMANNYLINEGLTLLNTDKEYDYLLLGDSNSNHYTRGILLEGSRVKNSWYATCISFPNSINRRSGNYPGWKESCINNYKLGLEETNTIIIAQSWDRFRTDSLVCVTKQCSLTGNYLHDLAVQLNELLEAYGKDKHIYLLGELLRPKSNEIMTCLKTNKLIGLNRACGNISEPTLSSQEVNLILKDIASTHKNITFIDVSLAFCNENMCNYVHDNKSIFMTDGSHLSGYGSELIWRHIIKTIELKDMLF